MNTVLAVQVGILDAIRRILSKAQSLVTQLGGRPIR